jgi:hypothetical protein
LQRRNDGTSIEVYNEVKKRRLASLTRLDEIILKLWAMLTAEEKKRIIKKIKKG